MRHTRRPGIGDRAGPQRAAAVRAAATSGLGAVPMGIIGLIEGIIYLTRSPADFERIYVRNKRGWF